MTVVVDVLTHESEVDAIAEEWRALHERVGISIFTDVDLIFTWWRTMGTPKRRTWHVVTARDDGRLVGLLPLTVVTRRGFRMLQAVGEEAFYQFEMLSEHPSYARPLWHGAKESRHYDFANIRDTAPDSPSRAVLGDIGARYDCDPELALRCEWTSGEEWKRSLSANLRKKAAKALRQMGEQGEVAFHVYEGNDPPMDVVEAMVSHRTTWSKTHGMRGMFDQPNVEDFFVELASGTARRAQLALASITCGDALVSQHMMFKYKTTIYSYVLGTDPAWNKYSPGNLAHIHAICWAIDNGCKVFDHLHGDFPYKHKFTNLHRSCEEFCFHRSTKGLLGREFFIARRALLRFVHNHRQRFVRSARRNRR